MASSLTYYTELQTPTVNGDVDLWGNILNATTDAWDRALAGLATASLAAGNWTPTTTEGECIVLKPTGILTANRSVIVPAKKRRYIVWNICTGAYTVTITAGGVGVVCPQGVFTYVYCDGTDVYSVVGATASSLTLTSTDAGAGAAPTLDLYRDSASPAANDLIGIITLTGEDSAGNTQTYATLTGKIIDPTSTSEDGELLISTVIAGTVAVRGHWGAGLYAEGVAGGDKGAGSINFTTIYQNNVALGTAAFATLGTSGTTVPLLDGNNTYSGSSTFSGTVAFTGSTFTYSSTDAGAGAGPTLDLYRNSASPAAADLIGLITLTGEDSAGNTQTYATIGGVIDDPTSTSEDGSIYFATAVAGTVATRVLIGGGIYSSGVTGGDKGAGSANFTSIYLANAALTSAATTAIGTSGATIPLLNGNNAYSGTATFTASVVMSGGAGVPVSFQWSDDGAAGGPDVAMTRISTTPAASDILARLIWYGRDSAANTQAYNVLQSVIDDPTSTSEDSHYEFLSTVAGALANRASIGAGLFMAGTTDQGAGTVNATNFYKSGVLQGVTPTIQVITASGTWTRPSGCLKVKVTVVGGGGGGGGADANSSSQSGAGGGGGAGGFSIEYIDVSALGSASVTIGAAGTAGTNVGGNGGNGGTSSFGTGPLLQATGGNGGTGSGTSVSTSGDVSGGTGGVGTSGDANGGGQAGGVGFWRHGDFVVGGLGGSSILGGGGRGVRTNSSSSTAGGDGSAYGAGGGGAACAGTTTGVAGGAGTAGVVIVEEFY